MVPNIVVFLCITMGLWLVRIWKRPRKIEFQQKSYLMVLVNIRLTIKPEVFFVFFYFFDGFSSIMKHDEYVSPEGRPKPPGICGILVLAL